MHKYAMQHTYDERQHHFHYMNVREACVNECLRHNVHVVECVFPCPYVSVRFVCMSMHGYRSALCVHAHVCLCVMCACRWMGTVVRGLVHFVEQKEWHRDRGEGGEQRQRAQRLLQSGRTQRKQSRRSAVGVGPARPSGVTRRAQTHAHARAHARTTRLRQLQLRALRRGDGLGGHCYALRAVAAAVIMEVGF